MDLVATQPADLILYEATPRDALITRLIGAVQLARGLGSRPITYSHVAIAGYAPGWQYESKWPTCGYYPIDRTRVYEVWRPKITAEQKAAVMRACSIAINRPFLQRLYPLDTLLTFGLITHKHAAVCSQWAAARYAAAPLNFDREGAPIVAPDVMLDSGRFEFIGTGGRRDG